MRSTLLALTLMTSTACSGGSVQGYLGQPSPEGGNTYHVSYELDTDLILMTPCRSICTVGFMVVFESRWECEYSVDTVPFGSVTGKFKNGQEVIDAWKAAGKALVQTGEINMKPQNVNPKFAPYFGLFLSQRGIAIANSLVMNMDHQYLVKLPNHRQKNCYFTLADELIPMGDPLTAGNKVTQNFTLVKNAGACTTLKITVLQPTVTPEPYEPKISFTIAGNRYIESQARTITWPADTILGSVEISTNTDTKPGTLTIARTILIQSD